MPENRNIMLTLMDAQILFRNFAGRQTQYNSEGERNFCVKLDNALAERLRTDGWNIKLLKPREEGDEPQPYMQVKVNYKQGRPPRCVMVTSRGRTDLGADEVALIDAADIKKIDLIINGYKWDVNGNQGVKAYLKSIFVTINEDELELMYAGIADADQRPGGFNDAEDD